MKKLPTTIKKSFIAFMTVVQVFGYSATTFSGIALADDTAAPTSEAVVLSATCPPANGTVAPTGAGSHTFIYDEINCTWENTYYSWNPVTKQYTAKYSQAPVYNPDTNAYEHTIWEYISSDGQYQPRVLSTPATVAQQVAAGDPPPATQQTDATGQTTGNGTLAQSNGTSTVDNGNGTDSNNTVLNNNNTIINADLSNYASVLTSLDSNATSGNAYALQNTTVGNVGTGDAAAVANILNMIQSSWNPANGDLNLFSADLYNNYFGDLLFDPSIALGNGTDSTNNIANNGTQSLTLNVEENASIQNDINLSAQSGDANANENTTVGNVSTGDAYVVANLINMINSMITTGESFIGNINLYGDLNGDILLPSSILEILLGNGTGSTNTIGSNQNTDIDADINTNSSITNNTDLTASSGNAEANANTTVGDVGTGDASTNVNEQNIIGQNIQGTKGLLVFVNVLGTWVGMLFNAPGTSSIVGGNGTDSTNSIANNTTTNADINVDRNYEIVNNLNLDAASGNATANANTDVGNVSTGNASSSANILNLIDSNVNFTDWFGVLFINVFGNWQGSFGVNTAAGGSPASTPTGGRGAGEQQPTTTSSEGGGGTNLAAAGRTFARQFSTFVSGGNDNDSSSSTEVAAATTTDDSGAETSSTNTGAASDNQNPISPVVSNVQAGQSRNRWVMPALYIVSLSAAAAVLGGPRLLGLFRKH